MSFLAVLLSEVTTAEELEPCFWPILLLKGEGAWGPSTSSNCCSISVAVVLATSRVFMALCSLSVCKPQGFGELFGVHIRKVFPQTRFVSFVFGTECYSGSEWNYSGTLMLFIANMSPELSKGAKYLCMWQLLLLFLWVQCLSHAIPQSWGTERHPLNRYESSFLLRNNTEPHGTLSFVLITFSTESNFGLTLTSPLVIIQLG